METLTGLLKKAAADFPTLRALSVPGKWSLTHRRLDELVDEAAGKLVAGGVRPGDVVALVFPNTLEVSKCRKAAPFSVHRLRFC